MEDADPAATAMAGVTVAGLVDQAARTGLTFERVDGIAEGDGCRVYRVHLQPSLWGGIDVVREWGRLNTTQHHPRRRATHHADEEAAGRELHQVVTRRLQRGYSVTHPAGSS